MSDSSDDGSSQTDSSEEIEGFCVQCHSDVVFEQTVLTDNLYTCRNCGNLRVFEDGGAA